MSQRLFIKLKNENLPQVKNKYPFIYLERGRLEVDDASVKWIDHENSVVSIPVSTISSILLGPGSTVTHAAIKVLASTNCSCQWVGEDSLLFYSVGVKPTANTNNLVKQISSSFDPILRQKVAVKLYQHRFKIDLSSNSIEEMMGLEGQRVKARYQELAETYNVLWTGRDYKVGDFSSGDLINKVMTASNTALYALITSVVHAMGFSPHVGFIHKGSPLPFIYDIADLYKDYFSFDLAFWIASNHPGGYDKELISGSFRDRILDKKLLEQIPKDIKRVLNVK